MEASRLSVQKPAQARFLFSSTRRKWTCANKGMLLRKRRPSLSLFVSLRDGIAGIGP